MTVSTNQSRITNRFRGRIAIAVFALIVLFHCVFVLGFVQRHGRLSIVPLYDDTTYLTSGLSRLTAIDRHGLPGLIVSMFREPPHSPYSTALAALGFSMTPESAIGSYILNIIWVFIFLALSWRILSGISIITRLGLMTASLSIPILATAIGSFRPDVSWGLITGGVAIILATRGIAASTRFGVALMGIVVGAATLTKPTGLPSGGMVMAVGFAGGLAIDLAARRLRPAEAAIRTLILVGGTLVVISPYLAVAWQDLLTYISNVMSRDADIWQTHGTLAEHAAFYLQPALSKDWIAWLLYAGPVLIIAAVVISWRSAGREAVARCLAVIIVVFVSYAIPSVSPIKAAFFGSLIYGTLIAASLWSAGRISAALRIPSAAVFIGGLLVFGASWRPSNAYIDMSDPVYTASDRATRFVLPAIMDAVASAQEDDATPIVYTSSPGPVYAGSLQYYAALQGLRANFIGAYTESDWTHAQKDMQRASVVFATEDGAAGQDHGWPFPMLKHQADTIRILSSDPRWHVLTTYADDAGFKTIVFSSASLSPRINVSFGDGFRGEEGPGFGLPRFHWMNASTASVRVRSSDAGTKEVKLLCDAVVASKIVVRDDTGAPLAEHDMPASTIGQSAMEPIKIPLDPSNSSGRTVRIVVTPQAALAPGWPGPMLCASAAGKG